VIDKHVALTVAIDARVPDIGLGGVQQVIRSLAIGFSELGDPSIQRVWIVYKNTTWWKEAFPVNDVIIELDVPFKVLAGIAARISPRIISIVYPIFHLFQPDKAFLDELLISHGVAVVHLPFQDGLQTELPTIYHPHDLQHEYFPEYFSWLQRHHRNTNWKQRAKSARVVMAATSSVKHDLESRWNIDPKKIRVVPIPPPNRKWNATAPRRIVEGDYILYPAVFWKHKNHINLIRAISQLVNRGEHVTCILTGAKGPQFKRCRSLIRSLSLENYIKVLGHVPDAEFGALVKGSSCVVIPSLFEAASLTVWDAQLAGIPVACSDIPIFRAQAADSVAYFDPYDPTNIADVLIQVMTDETFRASLIQIARTATSKLNSRNFASEMVGVYRSAANEKVSDAPLS
jgi:glycosyltransferase involved in cell wall biosynthesis